MSDVAQKILDVIRGIYGDKALLHEPCFVGSEWEYVKNCIDTGWVSSAGKYVDEFESRLAEFAGVKRAIVTVNGTSALHACLAMVGVEYGDEVLVPALTFVATANAVMICGATPHFVESEENTLGVDATKLRTYLGQQCEIINGETINKKTKKRVRALIPVHIFGHPVDMDPLCALCEEYNIQIVEDASESLGSYYKGKHMGHFGKLAVLSFNGNKIITTGGGGAILTNDEKMADRVKHVTATAKIDHRWDYFHNEVAYNYRMPNLNAALGCAQLETVSSFLDNKRSVAKKYQAEFDKIDGVHFFSEAEFAKSNYWLNAIILDGNIKSLKDDILTITNDNGVMTRPIWKLMHHLPMFENCPRMDLGVAESLERRVINIPSSVIKD